MLADSCASQPLASSRMLRQLVRPWSQRRSSWTRIHASIVHPMSLLGLVPMNLPGSEPRRGKTAGLGLGTSKHCSDGAAYPADSQIVDSKWW